MRTLCIFLASLITIGSQFSLAANEAARDVQCAFCNPEIIAKQKIYETKNFYLLVDYAPLQEGHLLLVAKRSIVHLHELNDDEAVDMNRLVKKIHAFFKDVLKTEDYIELVKNGKPAGQAVPHLHIHLIPIKYTGSLVWGQINTLYKIVFGSRGMSQTEIASKVQEYSPYFVEKGTKKDK